VTANQAAAFATTLVINTNGKNINAIDGTLLVAEDLAGDIKLSDSGSIITYWVARPKWDAQTRAITFSGAIPGGYEGQAGILFSIIFEPRRGSAIENAVVVGNVNGFLNDGLGTPAQLNVRSFALSSDGAAPTDPEILDQLYLDERRPDNTPPETFSPQLARDENTFDGKWFITFATTDKQSGIDYYEIQETRSGRLQAGKWKRAESPYLLEDQQLHSYIYVVAVDRAGNERMIKVFPRQPLSWWQRYNRDIIIGLSIIILLTTAVIISRRRENK
ncbi:MAG TPA: hypothetical protein PKD79_04370, partial [Candidatus Doudnabacteria bacterium]|nr:hypothetical protein [Candidatus Doudnabacteria bacterium]